MIPSSLQLYLNGILSRIPWWYWVIAGSLSLVLAVFVRNRKCSAYGKIAFGMSVFVGFFLLGTAVFLRYFGYFPHGSGYSFGMDRLIHPDTYGWTELISNFIAFTPLGFFLSEYLASTQRFRAGRQILYVTLAGLGLSLCIECLQLVLRVGFFEVTDLVMNTLGGGVGAEVAVIGRKVLDTVKT